VWFCFACHQGGDQLQLWSLSVQQSLYAATTRLCNSTGTPIPWLTSPQPPPCPPASWKQRKNANPQPDDCCTPDWN